MTFLSVVTRCYKRPNMLGTSLNSLQMQTDQDYEQISIVDNVGRGVPWANRALQAAGPTGDYVLILDDDDMLTEATAIEELRQATEREPDLVIFKCDHGPLGVLPDDVAWKRRPLKGHIGSCSFISKRQTWRNHIHSFAVDEGGDYAYLKAVYFDWPRPEVVWLDRQLTAVQRISKGAAE